MSNIINNNFNNLKLVVNNDEYWDFFVNKDYFPSYIFDSTSMYDKCLISYIDTELDGCINGSWLYGSKDYLWSDSVITDNILYNVGFTALDNGLISFRRDLHNNRSFSNVYTNSSLMLNDGVESLKLHQVSGGTHGYEYPVTIDVDRIKLNGGFYQGFFKTECDEYDILPSKLENGDVWHFEFVLNKTEFEKESNKTLNDKYPENKGIFFYLGTRAENKWVYLYNKDDECFALGIGDYVDGGNISKNDYKITNMLNANPDFVDYDEFAMDDYMSFKYYHTKHYEEKNIEEDDFFFDDYVMVDEKPKIIDETKISGRIVGWCCGGKDGLKNGFGRPIFNACGHLVDYEIDMSFPIHSKSNESNVCCGIHNFTLNESDVVKSKNFLANCEIFGDDYLSDIDDIDYGDEFIEEDLDISDFSFEIDGGGMLIKNQYYFDTDNKFLLFDRTCDGFNVKNWKEGTIGRYIGTRNSFKGNLFLLMNRTCTGYNVTTIDSLRDEYMSEYNVYEDLYNNALAFRITDDGEIGYRYIIKDCESENGISIKEGYSKKGIVLENEWSVINIKIKCFLDKMIMYFYVNGKLVFVTDEMQKLNLRHLKEIHDKQETVPFNISLGGGTQGLCDTILPNYMLDPYREYILEKNFGGTFIGYLKSFKFYNCTVEYMNIKNNSLYELNKLN